MTLLTRLLTWPRRAYNLTTIKIHSFVSFLCLVAYILTLTFLLTVRANFTRHLPPPGSRARQRLLQRLPRSRNGLVAGAVTALLCGYMQVRAAAYAFRRVTGKGLNPWGCEGEAVQDYRTCVLVMLFHLLGHEGLLTFKTLVDVTEAVSPPIRNQYLRGIVFGGIWFAWDSGMLLLTWWGFCAGLWVFLWYWRLTMGFLGLPSPVAQLVVVAGGLNAWFLGQVGYLLGVGYDAAVMRQGMRLRWWVAAFDWGIVLMYAWMYARQEKFWGYF